MPSLLIVSDNTSVIMRRQLSDAVCNSIILMNQIVAKQIHIAAAKEEGFAPASTPPGTLSLGAGRPGLAGGTGNM